MTTLGKLMNSKHGDPPLPGESSVLQNPTVEQLWEFCAKKFEEDEKEKEGHSGKEKPFFGPERPPQMKKGE